MLFRSVAVDIAKANDADTQRELLKAYESKQLNQVSIRTVKRLINQRQFIGKKRGTRQERGPQKKVTSMESLVSTYRRETDRQKLLVRKAKICESRLLFAINAFHKLLADEHFGTLLRAESLVTMPKDLWNKIHAKRKEAA